MKPQFKVPPILEPHRREVQAGSLRLFLYDAAPQKPSPLLLLHGLGDEADSWQRLIPLLAPHRRVIAPDLPGFGRSDHPHRAYTLRFFTQTLRGLLEALFPQGNSGVTLVGSSLGAAIALRFALEHPERVERLFLLDGPALRGRLNPRLLLFLLPVLGERLYNSFRRDQDLAYASLRPYYHDLEALPSELQTFLRERVWERVWSDEQRRAYFSTYRWLMWQALWGLFKPQELRKLKIPTTIVWGEQDHIAPADSAGALAEAIPGSRLLMLRNCGHLPQQEKPEELSRLLLEG
ncbi:alpha/beta fold hydrolase [Calidithermus timidus]|jgi:pimeloyl-ACP methyl ester carboxylesterase|uniref:alpha/beta fold hydrolase n=1 Tax=Calidithermus timidus TaxID=307124 RepID=UPI000374717A|nr:alpha/beta hydrolase [Calidithermus timidus]